MYKAMKLAVYAVEKERNLSLHRHIPAIRSRKHYQPWYGGQKQRLPIQRCHPTCPGALAFKGSLSFLLFRLQSFRKRSQIFLYPTSDG